MGLEEHQRRYAVQLPADAGVRHDRIRLGRGSELFRSDGYALSICSADFNEWVWKNTNVDTPYSYLLTQEYDMIEFDLAEVANYSDLANLMAPRPFMAERGHDENVSADEWVAHEYAKVRRFYDKMGIGDRTEIGR